MVVSFACVVSFVLARFFIVFIAFRSMQGCFQLSYYGVEVLIFLYGVCYSDTWGPEGFMVLFMVIYVP